MNQHSTQAPMRPAGRGAVLALDQGTTNTKALLVDSASGAVLSSASRPVGISFPAPGFVEQDAAQLRDATFAAALECLRVTDSIALEGISISNQRESVVCWNKQTGEPLGPVLGWQDARTAAWCVDLASSGPDVAQVVRTRTGLSLDAMFSAPKMRAALDQARAAGVDIRDIAVGTVDSWLIWSLTGEHLTEMGNAARTLLLDLESCSWEPQLLDLFGIPASALGEVRGSDAGFGRTRPGTPLLVGLPVLAVMADSHAAMYQQGCLEPGTGKATFGTGSSVMAPVATSKGRATGIATTLAWHIEGSPTYAREGNIIAAGSALDWMATMLGVPEGASGGAYLTDLAGGVVDADGVSFVPAFSGLGAPYWDRSADGVLLGVTAGTTRAHLARAALDAVAHQVVDVVEAIESDGLVHIDALRADGGATRSPLLMQIQADLLARPVLVGDAPEASALGAAALARRTLGHHVDAAQPATRFDPESSDLGPTRRAWVRAVARSRGLAAQD